MIAIVDYGMGNIHSVQKALEFFGAKTIVTNKPKDIRSCDKIVLPGVGAFDDAMKELKKQDLISALKEHIKNKKTFLGICLGMQLLFAQSQEAKKSRGLGVIRGIVKRFVGVKGLKVPHMGWNQLKIVSKCQSVPATKIGGSAKQYGGKVSAKCPLLNGIADGAYVYFCHSYYPDPKNKEVIAATCNYGLDFAAVVWQNNVYGVQFHPEKSQAVGMKMLRNFVNL